MFLRYPRYIKGCSLLVSTCRDSLKCGNAKWCITDSYINRRRLGKVKVFYSAPRSRGGSSVIYRKSSHCEMWNKLPCFLAVAYRELRTVILKLLGAQNVHVLLCFCNQDEHIDWFANVFIGIFLRLRWKEAVFVAWETKKCFMNTSFACWLCNIHQCLSLHI
jgi:hypothetical protein